MERIISIKELCIKFLFALPCLILPTTVFAQSQIMGSVQNPNGEPLPFANVLLLSPTDSSLVKGTITEIDGTYFFNQLTANEYLLSITSVGFQPHMERLKVSLGEQVERLPQQLNELDEELAEVIVTAQKPLFEKLPDCMVVNVQESISAAGSSVLEVLSRSPGVLVNQHQGQITLNGREGVLVMINNSITRIPMESLLQMLEGMSAANVERIELISQPPSHLDADGGGGVIHIMMKEMTEQGTAGSFGLTAGMKRGEVLGANFNLSHRGKSIFTFAEYAFLQIRNAAFWQNGYYSQGNIGIPQDFYSEIDQRSFRSSHQFRLGMEKSFGETTQITAYYNLNSTYFTSTGRGNTILQASDSLWLGDFMYREFRYNLNHGSHIHITHQLHPKHKFRFDYDWIHLQLDNPSNYENEFVNSPNTFLLREKMDLEGITPMNFHITALDYHYQPTSQLSVQAGVKKTWMDFNNTVKLYHYENGTRNPDPSSSDITLMNEDISAAYISGSWQSGGGWKVDFGLRYEHTFTHIRPNDEEGVIKRDYGNIFPNLLIHNQVNEKIGFTMGYSKRINRPSLGNLVPILLMINPSTSFDGNPQLMPAIVDNYRVEIQYKNAAISFEHSYAKDAIALFQPSFYPMESRIIMRTENLSFLQNTGLFLTVPWIISEKWDMQSNAQIQRRSFETNHLAVNQRYSFFDLNLNLVNTIQLGKGYSAEWGGNFQTRRNWGLWIFRPVGSLNLGVQKRLGGDRGSIRLAVNDLLNTNNILVDTDFKEYQVQSYVDYYLRNRTISINYSRPFGNNKLKAVKIESASEADRDRAKIE